MKPVTQMTVEELRAEIEKQEDIKYNADVRIACCEQALWHLKTQAVKKNQPVQKPSTTKQGIPCLVVYAFARGGIGNIDVVFPQLPPTISDIRAVEHTIQERDHLSQRPVSLYWCPISEES